MNVNNMILDSDHTMDKIVYFREFTITVQAGVPADLSYPHNLPFTPLVFGCWDYSPDFSSPHNFYEQDPVGFIMKPLDYVETFCYVNADPQNINLSFQKNTNTTFYIRVYAFEPTDHNDKVPFTSQYAEKYILNSEYIYSKLALKGVAQSSSSTAEDIKIYHNLGYIPQTMVWWKYNFQDIIRPYTFAIDTSFSNSRIEVDNQKITIKNVSSEWYSIGQIHYRIYYDQA